MSLTAISPSSSRPISTPRIALRVNSASTITIRPGLGNDLDLAVNQVHDPVDRIRPRA